MSAPIHSISKGNSGETQVYEARIEGFSDAYDKTSRANWPRDAREAYNQARAEVAGVKASYNSFAAGYNAQMSWRFTNTGDLPPGATERLPREFRTYVTN